VSEEQAAQPLTGKARRLANLKPWKKGQSGNESGRPKDIVNFGDLLMKEFYKTVPASLGGKTVNKRQGEIIAMQMVKGAINKGPMAQKLLLQFIVEHEARLARLEEKKLKKQAEGTSEIDWDAEKQQLYERLCKVTVCSHLHIRTRSRSDGQEELPQAARGPAHDRRRAQSPRPRASREAERSRPKRRQSEVAKAAE
jgi:hypothetical protein